MVVFERIVETFRFNYEYEIEFSDLGSLVQISACHTSLVSRVSLSAGKQQKKRDLEFFEMRLI